MRTQIDGMKNDTMLSTRFLEVCFLHLCKICFVLNGHSVHFEKDTEVARAAIEDTSECLRNQIVVTDGRESVTGWPRSPIEERGGRARPLQMGWRVG